MMGYHQTYQIQNDELRSYHLASMSGRGQPESWNIDWLPRAGLPIDDEVVHSSTKAPADKQNDDDRIGWQQPTEVGGYVSHRDQWL